MSSILVIGGNSDIGYATAKVFAQNKYNVHLVSRNISQLEIKKKEIEKYYDLEEESDYFKNVFENFYKSLGLNNKKEFKKYIEKYVNINFRRFHCSINDILYSFKNYKLLILSSVQKLKWAFRGAKA